eukprot:scaffold419077_cov25-Prasinocladus_malaysianus.AAC.1
MVSRYGRANAFCNSFYNCTALGNATVLMHTLTYVPIGNRLSQSSIKMQAKYKAALCGVLVGKGVDAKHVGA